MGAICRVVDIIHFNDDKDKLNDKEFLKVQNNYVHDILREGEIQHLHYIQYLLTQYMDLIGINMMDSIQKEKYIVVADYVSLARDMDCRQLGICERNQKRKSY